MKKKDANRVGGHVLKVGSAERRFQDTESTSDKIGSGSHPMSTCDSLLQVSKEVVDRETCLQSLDTGGVCSRGSSFYL